MKKANLHTGSQLAPAALNHEDSGGTIMGLVIGLAIGLTLALLVAFYISKTPPQERPGVKAPNLPLSIKPVTPADLVPAAEDDKLSGTVDLNKPLQSKVPAGGNTSADPIADIAIGKSPTEVASTKPDAKANIVFFVQTGLFASQSEADAQKASLAMQGMQSQISDGLVDGKVVWRVRIGPFANVDDSGIVRSKLTGMGIKPAVIKVNKQ